MQTKLDIFVLVTTKNLIKTIGVDTNLSITLE